MVRTESRVTLLLWVVTIAACYVTTTSASRFLFSLPSQTEECFREEVDSRSAANKLLFRFGIIDPEPYDFMDVTIKTPNWNLVESWNKTQANYASSVVRESGFYHLCFTKRPGSSKDIQVYYSFDFISTGTINVVLYANIAATVSAETPDTADYTTMTLATSQGKATKIGIVDYSLSGVSASLIHPNTRVLLMISVENLSHDKVDISIAEYPDKIQYPLSWQSLGRFATHDYSQKVFDNTEAFLGDHIGFDVTERFEAAIKSEQSQITFTIHANEDAEASITGTLSSSPDYYPQLIVEDMGLDLMREVAYFKERVFTLRGEITYIKSKERRSRIAAESANSRVMWLSLFTNLVLMWIAMAQVLYIRKMLESSY